MRRHAGSFVVTPRRAPAFLVAAALALGGTGGCAQILGLPDDTLCGPSGAGGCGGGAPGEPGDAGQTDASDAEH